jgi:hypothetical protein
MDKHNHMEKINSYKILIWKSEGDNKTHSNSSSHWKPNLFISPSHPCLADTQSDLQGGIVLCNIVHTGAYTQHNKNWRSGVHFTFTNGKFRCTSNPAMSCFWWLRRLGIIVSMYCMSLQKGFVIGSQWLRWGRASRLETRDVMLVLRWDAEITTSVQLHTIHRQHQLPRTLMIISQLASDWNLKHRHNSSTQYCYFSHNTFFLFLANKSFSMDLILHYDYYLQHRHSA